MLSFLQKAEVSDTTDVWLCTGAGFIINNMEEIASSRYNRASQQKYVYFGFSVSIGKIL